MTQILQQDLVLQELLDIEGEEDHNIEYVFYDENGTWLYPIGDYYIYYRNVPVRLFRIDSQYRFVFAESGRLLSHYEITVDGNLLTISPFNDTEERHESSFKYYEVDDRLLKTSLDLALINYRQLERTLTDTIEEYRNDQLNQYEKVITNLQCEALLQDVHHCLMIILGAGLWADDEESHAEAKRIAEVITLRYFDVSFQTNVRNGLKEKASTWRPRPHVLRLPNSIVDEQQAALKAVTVALLAQSSAFWNKTDEEIVTYLETNDPLLLPEPEEPADRV